MKSADARMDKVTEYRGYRLSPTVHRFQYGIEVSGIGVFDEARELVYVQSAELAKRWVDNLIKRIARDKNEVSR